MLGFFSGALHGWFWDKSKQTKFLGLLELSGLWWKLLFIFQKGYRITTEVKRAVLLFHLSCFSYSSKFQDFYEFCLFKRELCFTVNFIYELLVGTTERNTLLGPNRVLSTYDIYVKRKLCPYQEIQCLFVLGFFFTDCLLNFNCVCHLR